MASPEEVIDLLHGRRRPSVQSGEAPGGELSEPDPEHRSPAGFTPQMGRVLRTIDDAGFRHRPQDQPDAPSRGELQRLAFQSGIRDELTLGRADTPDLSGFDVPGETALRIGGHLFGAAPLAAVTGGVIYAGGRTVMRHATTTGARATQAATTHTRAASAAAHAGNLGQAQRHAAAATQASQVAERSALAQRVTQAIFQRPPAEAGRLTRALQRSGEHVVTGLGYSAVAGPLRKLDEGQSRAQALAMEFGVGAGADFLMGLVLGSRGARVRGIADRMRSSDNDIDRAMGAELQRRIAAGDQDPVAGQVGRGGIPEHTRFEGREGDPGSPGEGIAFEPGDELRWAFDGVEPTPPVVRDIDAPSGAIPPAGGTGGPRIAGGQVGDASGDVRAPIRGAPLFQVAPDDGVPDPRSFRERAIEAGATELDPTAAPTAPARLEPEPTPQATEPSVARPAQEPAAPGQELEVARARNELSPENVGRQADLTESSALESLHPTQRRAVEALRQSRDAREFMSALEGVQRLNLNPEQRAAVDRLAMEVGQRHGFRPGPPEPTPAARPASAATRAPRGPVSGALDLEPARPTVPERAAPEPEPSTPARAARDAEPAREATEARQEPQEPAEARPETGQTEAQPRPRPQDPESPPQARQEPEVRPEEGPEAPERIGDVEAREAEVEAAARPDPEPEARPEPEVEARPDPEPEAPVELPGRVQRSIGHTVASMKRLEAVPDLRATVGSRRVARFVSESLEPLRDAHLRTTDLLDAAETPAHRQAVLREMRETLPEVDLHATERSLVEEEVGGEATLRFLDFFNEIRMGRDPTAEGAGQASRPTQDISPARSDDSPHPDDARFRDSYRARDPSRQAPSELVGATDTHVPMQREPLGRVGEEVEMIFSPDMELRGQYRLVPLDDVQPSHRHDNFARNPRSPLEAQKRDLFADRGAQQTFEQRVANYDARRATDLTHVAQEGPPIMRQDGIVLAGHKRAMMVQRIWRDHPDHYTAYRNRVEELSHRIGMDPAEVRADFENTPHILVREITDADVDVTARETMSRLNDLSDRPSTDARDPFDDAGVRGEQLRGSPQALRHMAETMKPEQTIRAYLDTADGRAFVDRLIHDGIIARQEAPRFVDSDGVMTAEGKQLLEGMVRMAAIQDVPTLRRADEHAASVLRQLDTSWPAVVRASEMEGWDLAATIRGALDAHVQSRVSETTTGFDEFDRVVIRGEGRTGDQVTLDIGAPEAIPEDAGTLARFLASSNKNETKQAFEAFAREADLHRRAQTQDDLFGFEPKPRDQAFQDAFGGPDRIRNSESTPCR